MRLLLTRHGQTDWNAARRIQGQSDTRLNETGRAQARALAQEIQRQGIPVRRLYTSPQKRAMETAAIVGEALGLTPQPLEGLREISFGIWEGYTWAEIARRWPEEYAAYTADLFHVPALGGESYEQLLARMTPALEEIAAGEGPALAVAHSAILMTATCVLDGNRFDEEAVRHFYPDNAKWMELEL